VLTRRAALSLVAAGCARRDARAGPTVAVPERALPYAPLLLAVRRQLYVTPPERVALVVRATSQSVAASVADGTADAGAIPAAELVRLAAAGVPVVAIGALARRFDGQLVAAAGAPLPQGTSAQGLDALLGGGWRAVRLGLQAGSGGTEQALRFLLLAHGAAPLERAATDPLFGEPRLLTYSTAEALVAALKDGRIHAFLGSSLAAAQATLLGGTELLANFSDGSAAPDVTEPLCTVLIARPDRAGAGAGPGGPPAPFPRQLITACARAAAELSGPDGPSLIAEAIPERDPLHLATALRLAAPAPDRSVFALDGQVPREAFPRLLELYALAGHRFDLDPRRLAQRVVAG
jgi:hypothetical protein